MAALFIMKVEAELKITILEGDEKGRIDISKFIQETDTEYTEYGIIERLKLGWNYIHDVCLYKPKEGNDV